MFKKILLIILSFLLTLSIFTPIKVEAADVQYFQTTFPAGLRYSQGWYGTFTNAPSGATILLFDDDYTEYTGLCIFTLPVGKAPSGAQGGTVLKEIDEKTANTILSSYSYEEAFKPFDAEIKAVMPHDAYFTGAWAGEKLQQKWDSTPIEPPETLTERQQDYLDSIKDRDIKQVDLTRFDPDRFWVLDGGNWSDGAGHWSAVTGGAPGASVPTSADNAYFDANSFANPAQTVTLDVNSVCLDVDWTGATNNPTLGVNNKQWSIYGDATFIAAMTATGGGTGSQLRFVAGAHDLTSNGVVFVSVMILAYSNTCTLDLQDAFSGYAIGTRYTSTFTTNNHDITLSGAGYYDYGNGSTVNLGTSTIDIDACSTCYGWTEVGISTITANTATINLTSQSPLKGDNNDFNGATFNLNGSGHLISGNFTCATFATDSSVTQTLTFTDGITVTAGNFELSGDATHAHTIQSSGAGTFALTKTGGGTLLFDYLSVSHSVANPDLTFFDIPHGTDAGSNTRWYFHVLAPTNFTATKTGINEVTLDWTPAVGSNTTLIRVDETDYPSDPTLGYLVCNTTSATYTYDGLSLDTYTYLYSAWAYQQVVDEYSADYATTEIGGTEMVLTASFLFLGALAVFLTWASFKRKMLLLSIAAGLCWFALFVWFFFTGDPILGFAEEYQQIFAYVFLIMTFIPFLALMDTEIKWEKNGRSWSEWGEKPTEKQGSDYENYLKRRRERGLFTPRRRG